MIEATTADITNSFRLSGSYASLNRCDDSAKWQDWGVRTRITLFALYTVIYGMIFMQWLLVRGRSQKAKQILYGSFGTATIMMICYLILALVGDALCGCHKINSLGYTRIHVSVNFFQSFANFLLMLIMLLPLTLTLLRHNCFKAGIPKVLNSLYLGTLFILCVLTVATVSLNNINSHMGSGNVNLVLPITATFTVVYLAGALIATGYVLASLRTMLRYPTEFNGHLKVTLPALAFSFLAFTIVDCIKAFGWDVAGNQWTKATEVAFLALNLFFQFTTYELLLIVAGDKSFVDDDDPTGRGQLIQNRWSVVTAPQSSMTHV